ncbi:MAG: TIGR04438 family Trp-rich protein [Burkholderiaceae bacterium]|nr:TIGR04438 family Trp-rich protein [Burkholderiaceae bacterium]
MGFLLLGLALLAMKFAEFGPVAAWSWWLVLTPFGLAVIWWAYADATGLTQRRAIAKMDKRKAERRERDMEALGLGILRDKRAGRAQSAARRDAKSKPAAPPPASGSRQDPKL